MLEGLQLAIIFGVVVAFTGTKDLHRYSRAIGRITGRAVGYAKAARGELDSVMDRAQTSQMHKEMHETLSQLEAIRHEMRSGFSFTGSSRPFSRTVYSEPTEQNFQQQQYAGTRMSQASAAAPAAAPASAPAAAPASAPAAVPATPATPAATPAAATASPPAATLADVAPVPSGNNSHVVNQQHTATQGLQQAVDRAIGAATAYRGAELVSTAVKTSLAAKAPSEAPETEVNVVPVSAAAANRIPPRTGAGPPLGADVILEGVEEMKVAGHALEYLLLEQQQKQEAA